MPRTLHNKIQHHYEQIPSIRLLSCSHPQQITQIILTHCKLQSLQGIQEYTNLQKLNIKYNELKQSEELDWIVNPENIIQMNIQGNVIQYYADCMFISLKENGFSNLKVFNNRDYSNWRPKRCKRQKKISVKKLCTKADNLSHEMKKTLKKTIKQNVLQNFRTRANDQASQQQIYMTNKVTQRSQSNHQNHRHSYEDYLSQQKSQIKQISLQHTNFLKSVTNNSRSYEPLQQNKQNYNSKQQYMDHIVDNLQLDAHQIPCVVQPTAKFASQRQKNLPFRSLNAQKSIINQVYEDDQNMMPYQDDGADSYQNESFYSQYSDYSQQNQFYSRVSQMPNNYAHNMIVQESRIKQMKKQQVASAFYNKNLILKVYQAIRIRRTNKNENMPRRMKDY